MAFDFKAATSILNNNTYVSVGINHTVMRNQIRAAYRAYREGGLREVGARAAQFYLAPPEWIGLLQLREGDTVLDIGGYTGHFARLAADRVGSAGQVYTIEPNPRNLERLQHNCKHIDNIAVIPAAITDSTGTGELDIHPENPAGHRMSQGYETVQVSWEATPSERIAVETYSLDDLCETYGIGQIDYMKMDIEGGEVGALRGGERTLEAASRVMVEAYHRNPDPETEDRTCGPAVYQILHQHEFRVAVTEDYMVFGWRADEDKAPLHRRLLFTLFSGQYGIERI